VLKIAVSLEIPVSIIALLTVFNRRLKAMSDVCVDQLCLVQISCVYFIYGEIMIKGGVHPKN